MERETPDRRDMSAMDEALVVPGLPLKLRRSAGRPYAVPSERDR